MNEMHQAPGTTGMIRVIWYQQYRVRTSAVSRVHNVAQAKNRRDTAVTKKDPRGEHGKRETLVTGIIEITRYQYQKTKQRRKVLGGWRRGREIRAVESESWNVGGIRELKPRDGAMQQVVAPGQAMPSEQWPEHAGLREGGRV